MMCIYGRILLELELIHTNCPRDLVISDASSILDFADTLQEYVTSGKRTPIWLDSSMGLLLHFCFRIRGD